jgi:hypothetical protein
MAHWEKIGLREKKLWWCAVLLFTDFAEFLKGVGRKCVSL